MKVALQLHSVREALRYDPDTTLAAVAEMGFRYVELSTHDAARDPGRWRGLSGREMRSLAEAHGVRFIGGQVSNLSAANVDEVASFYAELGGDHVTIPIAYFPTRAALEEQSRAFNLFGAAMQRRGLQLLYLNHYHEFQVVEGEQVLDGLLSRTDPTLIKLALSPYWLMRGLIDPIQALRKYGSRVALIEQADFPLAEIDKLNMWEFWRHHPIAVNIRRDVPLKGGEIENIHPVQCDLFTEIGDGIMKLQEIVDEATAAGGVSYVTLRQDFSRRPLEFDSVRVSVQNYKRIQGVDWT